MQVVQQSHPLSLICVHQPQQCCPAGDEGSEARQSPSLPSTLPHSQLHFPHHSVTSAERSEVTITPGSSPPTELAIPEMPCPFKHICPHLWAPDDPVLG